MAVEAGIGGSILVASNAVANINKWTLTTKGNIVNTTPFQANGSWELQTPTTRGWTAQVDGWTDPADTNGQVALRGGINTVFALELEIDSTHHWSGNAVLTGIDDSVDASRVNVATYRFTGTGPIAYS